MSATKTSSIREELHQIATRALHLERQLTDGDLSEQLDSMQRLGLVIAIEDHYQICFEPDDDAQIKTVQDVVELIKAKLKEKETSNESDV
jgi:acyl carrier protein